MCTSRIKSKQTSCRKVRLDVFWGKCGLNGNISPPYPEVTLDNFGFPVGGRLAAQRAVLWPRLPKVAFLGVKNAVFQPHRPPRGPPCDAVNTKKLSFLCSAMMASKNLDAASKKIDFGPKNCIFGPQKDLFGHLRAHNSPPSG